MKKKSDLPTRICTVCEKAFSRRNKWSKDWNEVKYCSKRCSSNKYKK